MNSLKYIGIKSLCNDPKVSLKTKGKQLFNVPNTHEGKMFIKLMRKFCNKQYNLRLMGRGKDRIARCGLVKNYKTNHQVRSYIPVDVSEWFAVYLRDKKGLTVIINSPYSST
jgi:hypothetical protein